MAEAIRAARTGASRVVFVSSLSSTIRNRGLPDGDGGAGAISGSADFISEFQIHDHKIALTKWPFSFGIFKCAPVEGRFSRNPRARRYDKARRTLSPAAKKVHLFLWRPELKLFVQGHHREPPLLALRGVEAFKPGESSRVPPV